MATAAEHSEIVLAGILPGRKDLLDKAMRRLTPDHFPEKIHSNLFKMIERYADTVNSVLPRKYLDDFLRDKMEQSQYILYLEAYDALAEMTPADDQFHWSVEQLRTLAAEKHTGEAVAEAMEILKSGKELKHGVVLKGHEDAREFLLDSLSSIDRELDQGDAPEGLIQDDRIEILEEYAEAKHKREVGEVQGIGFGIENLDAITGGMQRGELAIIAASSSNGKSSVAAQSAWYAATAQGKNVVFFATETGRAQIRRKLIARHSKLEMFGYPEGLNLRSLKEGSLTPKEEKIFQDVVNDLTTNPNYGKIHLSQVPRGSTITSIEHKINRLGRNMGVDYAVMDYLALLEGTNRLAEERTKYVSTLRDAKLIAAAAADGLGIPFLSPWQMKREGRKSAEATGYYDMSDLSDTSEAEKIADLLISLYRDAENTGRYAEVTFQVLKARDGERANDILADADYATCTFKAKTGIEMPKAVTDSDFTMGSSLSRLYD